MFSLTKKVAVVTGGGGGTGRAVSIRFARAGAKVILANRSDSSQFAKEIGAHFIQTDVSQEEQVKLLMDETVKRFGHLDIIVNNAGIFKGSNPVEDINADELDMLLGINLKGVVWGVKHGARVMSNRGSIINVASVAGLSGVAGYGIYVLTKAGVIGFTKTAAMDLAPRQIRVNCICPSTINVGMITNGKQFDEKMKETIRVEIARSKKLVPLGRLGEAEDVAALCHFLASEDSSYITGTIIPLDGGRTAGISQNLVDTLASVASGMNTT
jgi:3alpha(or 20beta)-hydroxysteroid dehydrogenase